jgi:DNA-binding XRE family transcriptional regulator
VTAQKYREMREEIGSQDVVAKRLGLDKRTIQRRENGAMEVDREAELAIHSLHSFCFFARIFRIGPYLIFVLNGLDFLL